MLSLFFFFKQKTAYEMRISDWSSDVCSSDLGSGMPILNAVGSSLFSVGAFGSATAFNYALSGLVEWRVAGFFIAGGVAGGIAGMQTAIRLAGHKGLLTRIFAFVLLAVDAYMLFRILGGIGGRTEERRVGKEGGRTCGSRGAPDP